MPAELRHRPPAPGTGSCAGCVFSEPEVMDRNVAGDDDPTPVMECHRYPPLAISTPDEVSPVVMLWPQVLGDDWCGEFAPANPPGPDPAPGPGEAFGDELLR